MIDIDVADGGTGLAIGFGIGQFVVVAERLTIVTCADATGDVVLLSDDVVPDLVDGLQVGTVARDGCHVGHAGIHISGTHGVTHRLVLFDHGLVGLAVGILARGQATTVEEVLGLVEIFTVTCHEVEFHESHLGNLMSGHTIHLPLPKSDLAADTVGIADGDVEEVALARGLIVGNGTFEHVAKVVELMAQHLDLLPALGAMPLVRVLGVHGPGGVEVTVGLLSALHNLEHRIDIGHKTLVGIGLQRITGTFDGLIDIGVVERETFHLDVFGVLACQLTRSNLEIAVTARLLTLRKSQGDGHLAAGLKALSPETVTHLDLGKWHRRDGVTRHLHRCRLLSLHCRGGQQGNCYQKGFHRYFVFRL